MRKNWAQIAMLTDEQLWMTLITIQGEFAEGLSEKFPEFFLSDSDVDARPSREEVLGLIGRMQAHDEVVQTCQSAGIPYLSFRFIGSCIGSIGGVSYAKNGYNTASHGWGELYFRCSMKPFNTVKYEGAEWLVVWNDYYSGDAESFSEHTLVLIPVEALKPIEELKPLEDLTN